MTTGGLSSDRLGRLRDVLMGHVERGSLPGAVTLISRRGEVHVETLGATAIGGAPMRRDALFRITSMTKPITAVATMILVEECRLRLDEPVDALLPELAGRSVLTSLKAPLHDTVPAHRPLTLRDLLTFRMGLGNVFGPQDAYPITRAVAEQRLVGFGPPDPDAPLGPDEWIRRLGTLPLMEQPGELWRYNTGSYVLGVLIARATGRPLEEFFRERIFEPLGMADTAFSVPASKLDRLASCYTVNPDTGAPELYDGAEGSRWGRPPAFPDGAAGLVSTVDDYLAFGEMLLKGGRRGSTRILSRPSVEAMVTDQLTPEQKAKAAWVPGFFDSRGWGFGVQVTTRRGEPAAVPGQFGWDGGYGTSWRSDPKEEMVCILMTQQMAFPLFNNVYLDFWTGAYQAIDD